MDDSVDKYLKALEINPKDLTALGALEGIYRRGEKWEDFSRILGMEAGAVQEGALVAYFLFRQARTFAENLGDTQRAIASYIKALEYDPSNLIITQALEELYLKEEPVEYITLILEGEASLTEDRSLAISYLLRVGKLWEKKGGQADKVIEAYQKALKLEPTNLLVMKVLERILFTQQRWEELLSVILKEAEEVKDPRKITQLYFAHSRILEAKISDRDRAIQSYRRLLELEPQSLPAMKALEDLYAQQENWEGQIEILERQAGAIIDPTSLTSLLYLKMAEIYEDKLSQEEKVRETYNLILQNDPENLYVLRALEERFLAEGNWSDLIELYLKEAELCPDPRLKVALYFETAQIRELMLSQEEEAIEAYYRVLGIEPSHRPALSALILIYLRQERWREVLELYSQLATFTDDNRTKLALSFKIGKLYQEKFKDIDPAINSYSSILKSEPNNYITLGSLAEIYSQEERWEEFINIYDRMAEVSGEFQWTLSLYFQVAGIWEEKLLQEDKAIETYWKILEIDPQNRPALMSLSNLYEKRQDWEKLTEVCQRQIEIAIETREAIALNLKLGNIREEKLGQKEEAALNFAEAWGLEPENIKAMTALDRLYTQLERWESLISVLNGELKVAPDPSSQVQLYLRIGETWEEKLGRNEEAISSFRKAWEIEPENMQAMLSLDRLYTQTESWENLIQVLEGEERVITEPSKLINIGLRLGKTWDERLNQKEKAIEAYRRGLDRDPRNLPTLEALIKLYQQLERWEELINNYQLEEEAIEEPTSKAEIQFKIGKILEDNLKDEDKAKDHYENSWNLDPTAIPPLQALHNIYQKAESWEAVISTLEREEQITPDIVRKTDIFQEMGEIKEDRLSREEDAIQDYQKALDCTPSFVPALERSSQALFRLQRWDESRDKLQKLIELEKDPEKLVRHYLTLGKVAEQGFEDLDQAMQWYEEALKLDPTNMPTLEAVGIIYAKKEQWEKLITNYEQVIKLIPRDKAADTVPLYLKMGEVYSDKLPNLEKAIAQYNNVIRLDSGHLEAHRSLARLYGQNRQYLNEYISAHYKILQLDPLQIESYRALVKIFNEQKNHDKSYCIYNVLHLLKAQEKADTLIYDAYKKSLPKESKKVIDNDTWENLLVHPEEKSFLRDIWIQISDDMDKIFPPKLEKHGLKKSDRISPKTIHNHRRLCDELVLNLTLNEVAFYVSQSNKKGIALENTMPPSIIVGSEALANKSTPEQRFLLGKYLGHIRGKHILLQNLSREEVKALFSLIPKLFSPEPETAGTSEADNKLKLLRRAFPRKAMKLMETSLDKYRKALSEVDYSRWSKAMQKTGNRTGLLLSNDLKTSISAVIKSESRSEKVNLDEDPQGTISQSEEAKELLLYSVSEAYFSLRQKAGFSVTSV
ncbi:MAG: tetratricopeptide repeat protein [Deltaproteobacteria bacterium]|nr:MAG: tetratricopeptide repeat protein [Deltaproteobacteria bacterium]